MNNSRPSYWGPEYDGLSPTERSRQVQRDQNQWDLLQAQEKANALKEEELRMKYTNSYNNSYSVKSSRFMTNHPLLTKILLTLFILAFIAIIFLLINPSILLHIFGKE